MLLTSPDARLVLFRRVLDTKRRGSVSRPEFDLDFELEAKMSVLASLKVQSFVFDLESLASVLEFCSRLTALDV